ncbi:MAG: PEP-CTERM sorting domain-containing protein [Planctomycetia bacterium]|nr:PEP-CTERM sorting domain-containing protein [Planctomycetia bacterium]
MRNMKMALVVLAVLAMASTAFAGLVITVDAPTIPLAGYESYLVRASGADTFVNINIDGTVVQSNKFDELFDPPYGFAPIPTVWLPGMPTLHKAMDTHMMMAKPSLTLGVTGNETNDGYEDATPIIPSASSYWCGLGTFRSDAGSAFTFSAQLGANSPFMQVVIPAGTMVVLSGTTEGGGVIRQTLGVPEPGTIALLIAGALCLVVARFRK